MFRIFVHYSEDSKYTDIGGFLIIRRLRIQHFLLFVLPPAKCLERWCRWLVYNP